MSSFNPRNLGIADTLVKLNDLSHSPSLALSSNSRMEHNLVKSFFFFLTVLTCTFVLSERNLLTVIMSSYIFALSSADIDVFSQYAGYTVLSSTTGTLHMMFLSQECYFHFIFLL